MTSTSTSPGFLNDFQPCNFLMLCLSLAPCEVCGLLDMISRLMTPLKDIFEKMLRTSVFWMEPRDCVNNWEFYIDVVPESTVHFWSSAGVFDRFWLYETIVSRSFCSYYDFLFSLSSRCFFNISGCGFMYCCVIFPAEIKLGFLSKSVHMCAWLSRLSNTELSTAVNEFLFAMLRNFCLTSAVGALASEAYDFIWKLRAKSWISLFTGFWLVVRGKLGSSPMVAVCALVPPVLVKKAPPIRFSPSTLFYSVSKFFLASWTPIFFSSPFDWTSSYLTILKVLFRAAFVFELSKQMSWCWLFARFLKLLDRMLALAGLSIDYSYFVFSSLIDENCYSFPSFIWLGDSCAW